MSVALREVKRRINSTRHIGKVTSALQQVSSAKLSKDRRNVANSSLYTEHIVSILQGLVHSGAYLEHPLLTPSSGTKHCVLLIGSDRGLCGGYNSALIDKLVSFAQQHDKDSISLQVVGQIPRKRAEALGFHIEAAYPLPALEERKDLLDSLVNRMADGFADSTYGKCAIIYTHFITPIDKQAVVKEILPISSLSLMAKNDDASTLRPEFFESAIYDPSASELLDALIPEVLRQTIDFSYLHSVCSEDAFRQEAMMRASDNAKHMLKELSLSYSRLRQESITTEMLEIAAAGGI